MALYSHTSFSPEALVLPYTFKPKSQSTIQISEYYLPRTQKICMSLLSFVFALITMLTIQLVPSLCAKAWRSTAYNIYPTKRL